MNFDAMTLSDLFLIESDRISEEFDTSFINIFTSDLKVESVSDSFITTIKKFFTNITTSIRNFMNKLSEYLKHGARESSYIATLNSMEKKIKDAKEDGKTKVTMTDYVYLRKQYKEMCDDLKKYAKKFVKMKYTSTIDIDKDLDTFMKISSSWEKKMNEAQNKTITISLDDALRFVENEKRGYTHTLDSLNDLIQTVDEMRHVAEETANRVDSLGSDIIPKHVNFIKKMTTAISNKVTHFISKTIAINVLLFA